MKRRLSDVRHRSWRWDINPVKLTVILIIGLMVLTAASVVLRDLPFHTAEPTLFHGMPLLIILNKCIFLIHFF